VKLGLKIAEIRLVEYTDNKAAFHIMYMIKTAPLVNEKDNEGAVLAF